MHNPQGLSAKKAETRRPFLGQQILEDEQFSEELVRRAMRSLVDFKRLSQRGIQLSPFLEIGAGNGQRSLALFNHFGAVGVATDLSHNSLHNTPFVQQTLAYAHIMPRICCDAHHLPFMPGAFSIVFAYRSLHHFSDPKPVIAEAWRVLGSGGYFYFNEEPLSSPLRRMLRGRRILDDPPTRMQRLGYRLGLEKVFWDDGGAERAAGITEARFDRALWRQALSPFDDVEVKVNRRFRMKSDLERPRLSAWLSSWIGGNIEGLCLKKAGKEATGDPLQSLICLDCGAERLRFPENRDLICPDCGRKYPLEDGVLRMLPLDLELGLFRDAE